MWDYTATVSNTEESTQKTLTVSLNLVLLVLWFTPTCHPVFSSFTASFLVSPSLFSPLGLLFKISPSFPNPLSLAPSAFGKTISQVFSVYLNSSYSLLISPACHNLNSENRVHSSVERCHSPSHIRNMRTDLVAPHHNLLGVKKSPLPLLPGISFIPMSDATKLSARFPWIQLQWVPWQGHLGKGGLLFMFKGNFLYQSLSCRGEGSRALERKVGSGGVVNLGKAGCVPSWVLPMVGPVCCNGSMLWNHQGWGARPQREWL